MIMEEFYIVEDGLRLHAKLEKPEGKDHCPLMILVHGLTGNMEERHILGIKDAVLSAGIAVLRVEMYGHGQSDGNFYDHTILKWLTNAMTVTDYVQTLDFVTDVYLCGHSQGGLLTLIASGVRPDAYKAAILLSPGINIMDIGKRGWDGGFLFYPERPNDDLVFKGLRISGNYVRAARLINVNELAEHYRGPVLIVHGDQDVTVPVQYSIDIAEKYADSKLVIIPGDTHCYDNHLDQVEKTVKEFLLSLPREL